LTSFDAKKLLPAQPLEPWQKPEQDITLVASSKGSFDSHVRAEKGPKAISGLAKYNSPHHTVVGCYEKLFNSSSRAFMS